MVCYRPQGPFPLPPGFLWDKESQKSCFVQSAVQRSARDGLGAVESTDLYQI